jgi:hypothetical protein
MKGVTQKVKPKKAKKQYVRKPKNGMAALDTLGRLSFNAGLVEAMTAALPDEHRDKVEIGYGINLDRLVKGKASMDDIEELGFLANVTVILCETRFGGFGSEHEQLAIAGQLAVVNAFRRGLKGGNFGLSGPEIQAVRGVYELHVEQMRVCSQAHLIAATTEVERRQNIGEVIRLVPVKQAA